MSAARPLEGPRSQRPPPLPRPLARRLDRLARGAHAFHRYAHHPLCGRYAGELVPLGRRSRVCRGCALALTGALTGVALGAAASPSSAVAFGALAAAGTLAALSMARAFRPGKLATRFAPTCALAFAFSGGPAAALTSAALASALWLAYRRRGPDRTPCETCPERAFVTCAGYAPMVRRERAFARVAARLLAAR